MTIEEYKDRCAKLERLVVDLTLEIKARTIDLSGALPKKEIGPFKWIDKDGTYHEDGVGREQSDFDMAYDTAVMAKEQLGIANTRIKELEDEVNMFYKLDRLQEQHEDEYVIEALRKDLADSKSEVETLVKHRDLWKDNSSKLGKELQAAKAREGQLDEYVLANRKEIDSLHQQIATFYKVEIVSEEKAPFKFVEDE